MKRFEKRSRILNLTLGAVLALGLTPAMADDSTTAPTTQVSTSTSSATPITDNLVASYWGNFSGPRPNFTSPTANPSSDGTNGENPTNLTGGSPIGFDNVLTLGYKVTPVWTIAANSEFHEQYGNDGTRSQYLWTQFNDPFLQVKRSKLIDTSNGVTLAVDGRVYAPVSTSSQGRDEKTSIRSTQYFNWDVPHTKLSISDYSYIRYYFYKSEASLIQKYDLTGAGPNARAVDFILLADPYFNYQLTDTFALAMWTDFIQLQHIVGTQGLTNPDMDLEPGVSWDVTKHLNLNPYINIYPRSVMLNSMYLGMVVTAHL